MPSKRHEELRQFGIRILTYMGIRDIEHEKKIEVKLSDGTLKSYIIDTMGYTEDFTANNGYNKRKDTILVEIGSNYHEKIFQLRLSGYNVIVIPYTEKEEEWQDEKMLMNCIKYGNKNLQEMFHPLTQRWIGIAESKIEEIESKQESIKRLNEEIKYLTKINNEINDKLYDLKNYFSRIPIYERKLV
jgi:hypothetical protein